MPPTSPDAIRTYPSTVPNASRDFWYKILAELPHGIAVLDARGVHLEVNTAFCRMTGFKREELIGIGPPYPYWGPDSAARMGVVLDAADCGHAREVELVFQRKHGEPIAALVQASVVNGEDDSALCHVVSARYATENDRAKRELKESEQRLQLALAAAEMGTFDIDFSRGITTCSPRAHAIFGYEAGKEEMPQSLDHFFAHVHPEDATGVKRAVRRHLQTDTQVPFEVEYRLRRTSGEYIWIHSRARKLVEPDGTTHVWGFVTDISARKHIEQDRERLEAQLRKAQKMDTLGTLAGGMAHDFNNLLTPILATAEHLLRLSDHEASREDLRSILGAAERAREIVSRILLFGRRSDPDRLSALRLPDVARMALRLLTLSLPSNIRVETEIQEDCPDVWGSSDEILQALTNLGMNALQALRPKGGQLRVSVQTVAIDEGFAGQHNMPAGRAVRVGVEDDGPGMPAEVMARAFEPFFTTKPVGEGSGLGLAMVQAITTRHRGAVIAESRLDEGARFELYFPAHEGLPPMAAAADDPPLPERRPNLRAQVICVDDEPAVLKTFELIIAHAGHQVTLFASSTDALEWMRANPHLPDLVITDQTMPDLTGLELADELCELAPSLPVILVSGYTDVGSEEAPRPNIRLTLCKPVGYDALLNAVAECLAPRFKPATKA